MHTDTRYWKKLSHREQEERITAALARNVDFTEKICLGIPASQLDPLVFHEQAAFLKDAPLLRTYVKNPNHIGCHTFGNSEPFFAGTQQLEREVIDVLSTDLFYAPPHSCDGYIASGGTEANIQAAWIYRNYFRDEMQAQQHEIALLASADTHYSVAKAANLLHLTLYTIPVTENERAIEENVLDETVKRAAGDGIRCFIVFCNMGTTMFGSIDDPDLYARVLCRNGAYYRLHIDGAFGGFVYPVSNSGSRLHFANPVVSSITLDAHKMLQAPYGTGIFLARKGLMKYAYTKHAKYVSGMDMTLSGSRGGVNAVAIWMILFTYGPYGWLEKINKLLYRTAWLCEKLDEAGIMYYRHPSMNIVTIKAAQVPAALVKKFGLVPDNHDGTAEWYKIVVMDHVSMEHLQAFATDLRQLQPA
jgi:glutamate/tyrosine decarboxylase-like PLP-dependent enzyme